MLLKQSAFKKRLLAGGVHLGISLSVAVIAATVVFGLWYPYPYRDISGGRELFLLIVSVDVVLGPLLTLAIFNDLKARKTLALDLFFIGFLQTAALAYGLWTLAVARPAYLVFEFDRFRVVHAIDISDELLPQAPAELRRVPVLGPKPLAVRPFHDQKENFDATMAALQGIPLGARPDLWQTYAEAKPRILAATRPLGDLKKRFPARADEIDRAASAAAPGVSVGYLPMIERHTFWTVLIDLSTAEIIAFVSIDSF
jgi:hypothetical protein